MNCWYIKDFINKKGSWDFSLKWVPFTCCSKQMKFGEKQIDESHFVVESLSCVRLFVTSWTAARQASLSLTISWSLLKLMSIELVMPSYHLVPCRSLLLLASVFLSIRVFSNELALHIRWPKYWSFNFSISPSNKYSGLISFRINRFDLLAVQDSQECSPAPQFKSINSSVLSLLHSPTLTSIHDHKKN